MRVSAPGALLLAAAAAASCLVTAQPTAHLTHASDAADTTLTVSSAHEGGFSDYGLYSPYSAQQVMQLDDDDRIVSESKRGHVFVRPLARGLAQIHS